MHSSILIDCDRCGEAVSPEAAECPYCGNDLHESTSALRNGRLVEFSLKDEWRSHDTLIEELLATLDEARRLQLPGYVLIHGYGSGGRGGRLRSEARQELDAFRARGMIRDWIAGEQIRHDAANLQLSKQLRRRLARHAGNDGVSIVLL